jgi:flagellar basal-body rod modification protein FlgD
MQVSSLAQETSLTQSSQNTTTSTTAIKGLSQDDFLKLLLTQLQAQDPLKPLDNQEFAAQLATFNSLDQLININKKLESFQDTQARLSQLEATALIGKEVRAVGNGISFSDGDTPTLHYSLDANAARVVVNITDAAGNLVRALEVGGQNAGQQTATWDGKDTTGATAPPGTYTFAISAIDVSGNKVGSTTFMQGLVTGMNMNGSEPYLEISGVEIPLSAVTSVHAAKE